MPVSHDFLEERFPDSVSQGAQSVPRFRTTIEQNASGFEDRNGTWEDPITEFAVALGNRDIEEIEEVYALFIRARGPLYGFRFKNWLDFKSSQPGMEITPNDQVLLPILAQDSSSTDRFQIRKTYPGTNSYIRTIKKPVQGKVQVAGVQESDYSVDYETGVITFNSPRDAGTPISCGFEFDYAVRFLREDTAFQIQTADVANMPTVNLIEILLP